MRSSSFFFVSALVSCLLTLGSGCKLGYDFGSNGPNNDGSGGAEVIGCALCGNGVCEEELEDSSTCPADCGGGGGSSPGEGGAGGWSTGEGGAGGWSTGEGGAGGSEEGGGGAEMGGAGGAGEGGASPGSVCGDGFCDPSFENVMTCPADCSS